MCVSNIDSYRPRSHLFVCSRARRPVSDFLPTIPNPVRLSHICCLLFKETSVSVKRVSLALYFIDAFHILPSIHSVSGYVLPLFMLSNIEATRSVYMCNSYTLRSHALTFSPPLLSVGLPCLCSFWYRLSVRRWFYVGVTSHQGTRFISPFVLISLQRYVLFLIYSHIFLIILIFIIEYLLMY